MNREELVELLIDFQLFLEGEGLIENHDWDFEEKAIKFQYYKEKAEQKKILIEMMEKDAELGLYNEVPNDEIEEVSDRISQSYTTDAPVFKYAFVLGAEWMKGRLSQKK